MSRNPKTEAAYEADRARFVAWCGAEGYALVEGVAVDPTVVGAWLAEEFNAGAAASTVRRRSAAVGAWHVDRGFKSPTRAAVVQDVLSRVDAAAAQASTGGGGRRRRSGVVRSTVTVRASAGERVRWEREAERAGLSLSAWVGLTCDAAVSHRKGPSELADVRELVEVLFGLRRDLGPVGSNLNQIAHVLNAGGGSVATAELEAAVEAFETIADAVRQVTLDAAQMIRAR